MAERKPRVGAALVGLGFMGLTHLRAWRSVRGGKLIAIVTSDPRKARGDFSMIKGNFGAAGAKEDLSGIEICPTIDDVLANSAIDLVDICLPSHLHAEAALRSLGAGKAVLVEKPIAIRPADGRRMVEAAARAGRPLMVAQVLKFMPEFGGLISLVEKNTYGKLRALHCRRIIAKPDWGDDSWFKDSKLSGGMVVDLHIHDTDFIVHLFGKPESVTARGLVEEGEIQSIRTVYEYGAEGPLVTAEAGWINAAGLPFEHGYDAYFEGATVHFDSSYCPVPRVYRKHEEGKVPLPKGDGFVRELQAAVDSVREGSIHPFLRAEGALAALEVTEKESKAAEKRSTVKC